MRRAPALYERRCSTRVDALEACVLGSVPTRQKPSAAHRRHKCKAIDALIVLASCKALKKKKPHGPRPWYAVALLAKLLALC